MLNVGHECSACGLPLYSTWEETAHLCLREDVYAYSVELVYPTVHDDDAGNEYRRVLAGAPAADVTAHLRGVVDPENYRVYEWVGHEGIGTANDGESTWGDLWLEENGDE